MWPPMTFTAYDLEKAIETLDYEKVEEILSDPSYPLEKSFCYPLMYMFRQKDAKLARLFLNCPRIDFVSDPDSFCGLRRKRNAPFQMVLQNFYYLDDNFINRCPREAEIIYERIFANIKETGMSADPNSLLLYTCDQFMAFKLSLKYANDINIKTDCGKSLLHITEDVNIIKLLVQMGAEINVLDADECTPLMVHSSRKDWDVVSLLVKLGADVSFVNSKGESAFSKCEVKNYFLDKFTLTENVFVNVLRNFSQSLSKSNLETIFAKYPEYRQIFESNLPLHLCAVKEEYGESFDDDDYLTFVKNMIRLRSSDIKFVDSKRNVISEHVNELLHLAVQAGLLQTSIDLITGFRADPNCLINGKTPLFHAKYDLVHILLKKGADPFVECDGFKFFERADFCQGDQIDAACLILLHRKGFDLFEPAVKTGKSLINHLRSDGQIVLDLPLVDEDGDVRLLIPVTKLSTRFFTVLSQTEIDFFSPIDDDDNTVLHYYMTQRDDEVFAVQILKQRKYSTIRKLRNKMGISFLDVLLHNVDYDTCDYFKSVSDIDEFKYLEADYLDAPGAGLLEKFGNKPFYSAVLNARGSSLLENHADGLFYSAVCESNYRLAEYILSRGFCRDLVKVIRGVKSEMADRCRTRKPRNPDWQLFLKHCYQLNFDDCRVLILFDRVDLVLSSIENCKNVNKLIDLVACEDDWHSCIGYPLPFNDAWRAFFSHKKILKAVSEADIYTLDLYFFKICCDSFGYKMEFLVEMGVDARRLIGSGLHAKVLCNHYHIFYLNCLEFLHNHGWKASDYVNLLVTDEDGINTLRNWIYKFCSEYFLEKYKAILNGQQD